MRWVATVAMDPVVTGVALVTGVFNTAGGGGAILTFVALSATGVPALTAHVTSQVVTPVSFLGGVGLVRKHRPGWRTVLAGCVGAVGGVWVLAVTPPETFQAVVPWCLVPAAVLFVAQGKMRAFVERRRRGVGAPVTVLATVACGLYTGMIGVGTGTLAVAVLGLAPVLLGMSLPTLVRTRDVLLLGMALVVSGAFALSGLVDWALAARLVPAAAVGGWLGTRLVGRLSARHVGR